MSESVRDLGAASEFYGDVFLVGENAAKLQGDFLMVVGELDTNVDPSSSLQVANALIKANKMFDMLVIPGAGHTNGGAYGTRKMTDFFVRSLLDGKPPKRNNAN